MARLRSTSLAIAASFQAAAPLLPFARSDGAPSPDGALVSQSAGLALPKDKTITISVIAGPSKGFTHRLTEPRISVGRTGGGADIEIDDPEVSDLHCAVGVKQDMIRLCDLESTKGTYMNNQRVEVAPLGHLSKFRVGSSLLLVTVLAKRDMDTR